MIDIKVCKGNLVKERGVWIQADISWAGQWAGQHQQTRPGGAGLLEQLSDTVALPPPSHRHRSAQTTKNH